MKKYLSFRRTKILLLIIAISLSGLSCKKLIEIPPNPDNEIPTQTVFSDSASVMSAIAGVYNNFNVTGALSVHSGAITLTTGLAGDELGTTSTDPAVLQLFANGILPNNSQIGPLWSFAYKSLYQVNTCIIELRATTAISESLKKQLTGELLVIRALYYFNLTNLFGGVPLITGTDYNINEHLPQVSVDSVYGQIVSDLQGALNLLGKDYPSEGRARPNQYVAEALLAKVSLYKSQYAEASRLASDVINAGIYTLEPDPGNVFLDGSREAIWQLPANGVNFQTAEAYYLTPYASFATPSYIISDNLLNAFEPGDIRRKDWIGLNTISVNSVNANYYYPSKYKNRSPTATPQEDYMILRLGEQYLIRAEALAHENKLDSALSDLNVIRNRAGLSDSKATQASVLDSIMHERQTELFCEWGNRWYDLKRTGRIDAVFGKEKTGWNTDDALFPVPLAEIQANPFLRQNPGYQ